MALGDYSKTTYVNGAAPGISAERLNRNEDKTAELDTVVAAHLSDSIYQTAGGTATAITLSISETIVNGFSITFIASANNNGAATTINTKPLYKPNTTSAPALTAGKAYTVWYNSSSNCFFIKASEGGDLKLSNLVKNGNFAQDLNCWTTSDIATASTSNNILSYTASVRYGTIIQAVPKPNAGDKIYVRCKMKGATSGRFIFYQQEGNGLIVLSPTIANTWQTLSAIATYPSNGVYGAVAFDDGASSGWSTIQVKECTYVNLTQKYGSGNEPTKSEIDDKLTTDGWQDSDLTLLTADATLSSGNQLLSGYTAYVNGWKLGGNIPNNSFSTKSTYTQASAALADGSGHLTVAPQAGYYDSTKNQYGFGQIIINEPNLVPANILNGVSMFGITGTNTRRQWQTGTVVSTRNTSYSRNECLVSNLAFTPRIIIWWSNNVNASNTADAGFGVDGDDPSLPEMRYYDTHYDRTYETDGFKGYNSGFYTYTEQNASVYFMTNAVQFYPNRSGETYNYIIIG